MNDTCTVLSCYVVTRDYTECTISHRLDHGQKLFVFHADEIRTFVMGTCDKGWQTAP